MALLAFMQCAHPVSPSGGPKDTEPPTPVSQLPANRTTGFSATRITLTFNEFITLKDQAKEIFISPPMKKKPEFKVRGKSLLVEFREALLPEMTYTLNFGNAIVDFTEGNPLTNYEYVFSTGSHIDSLFITGKVINAFSHQPEPDVLVMLYRDNNDTLALDSLPLYTPPVSASKTYKDGTFRVNNLAPGEYLLFALQDLNSSFTFDLPNEKIAFLDSLLVISPPPPPLPDTVVVDTIRADTVPGNLPVVRLESTAGYVLHLFEEADSTQKLLSKKLTGNQLITYIFRMPADSLSFTLHSEDSLSEDWFIPEYSKNKDTVSLWLQPGLPDTLRVFMRAKPAITDTARFILPGAGQEKPGKQKDAQASPLKITSNATAGAFDLNKTLLLNFPVPVAFIDPGKIRLASSTDTIQPPFEFTDAVKRQGMIDHAWLEGESYQVTINDSAFADRFGHYNDSLTMFLKVRRMSDYGTVLMNITTPGDSIPCIIQLLTEKEAVVREYILNGPGEVKFDYLLQGKYKLKAIHDKNMNGRWDTGDYRLGKQPEKVSYYLQGLQVRSNWDLQEEWTIGFQ